MSGRDSILKRMAKHTAISGDCWVWTGYCDRKGYGQVKVDGMALWVHRIGFVLYGGRIRSGCHVHHKCFNPSCWNPDHLQCMAARKNSRLKAPKGLPYVRYEAA